MHDARDWVLSQGGGFHRALAGSKVIDTGPMAHRVIGLCKRLNAVRKRSDKHAVVLWGAEHQAVTAPGKWIYVHRDFAARLSDDALAFVLAHEMSHHDLDHLTAHMEVAKRLGYSVLMEYQADAHALDLVERAGFDPRGALEALDPTEVEDIPPDARFDDWPPRLREWALRFVTTHPPHQERYDAILERMGS